MDWGAVLKAAAIGGAVMGLGTLVAFLLPVKLRAVAIGVFAGISAVAYQFFDGSDKRSAEWKAELEAELRSNRLFTFIAAEFPDEYEELEISLATVRSSEASRRMGYEFTAGLRVEHAERLRQADQTILKAHVRATIATLEAVEELYGEQVCAAFAIEGAAALPDDAAPVMDDIIDQGIALFEAILTGLETERAPLFASEADWSELARYWESTGRRDAFALSISTPDAEDPVLCEALKSLNSALVTWEGEAANRVWAENAVGIASAP